MHKWFIKGGWVGGWGGGGARNEARVALKENRCAVVRGAENWWVGLHGSTY